MILGSDGVGVVAARWKSGLAAVVLAAGSACGGPDVTGPIPADPAAARIITEDVARFWAAYDAGGRTGQPGPFQALYLDPASAGLRDFIRLRSITAASLAEMVAAFPDYFAAIRATSLGLATNDAVAARIRANYATIKTLYPAAVFPPVTLLIGRFSTGGTIAASGMLIGSEFYSATPDTPLDELGMFQRDNVRSVDGLPVIVAHEHAHVLQGRAGGLFSRSGKTLLEQSLLEGGADFVGELSSGGNINSRLWTYGLANEAALWAEFRTAMHGTDVSRWLYNQGTAASDRPGDLGYFIGYRIVEAYYARLPDKAAALRDIVAIADAPTFLASSGYAP